jgi:hypothetical protein
MALDSNSPGDERGTAAGSDRAAAAGLKLVGERGSASGAAGSAANTVRPGLAAGPGAEAGAGASTAQGSGRKSGRQLPLWLFVALFVVFLVAFGYQTHHAGRLESEVARLEASLAKAQTRLESHRTHLLEIRGGVHDLSTRLEGLRALIDRDPTVEAGQGAPPADTASPAEP